MRSIAPLLVVLVAAASPLAADDVYLKNGRVFEDVIAETGPKMVRIRLAFGEMAFSLDAVDQLAADRPALRLSVTTLLPMQYYANDSELELSEVPQTSFPAREYRRRRRRRRGGP